MLVPMKRQLKFVLIDISSALLLAVQYLMMFKSLVAFLSILLVIENVL